MFRDIITLLEREKVNYPDEAYGKRAEFRVGSTIIRCDASQPAIENVIRKYRRGMRAIKLTSRPYHSDTRKWTDADERHYQKVNGTPTLEEL